MINLSVKLEGIKRSLDAVVTPDADKSKRKEFVLIFDLSQLTVEDVIELALRPRRITWQNAHRYNDKLSKMDSVQNIVVKALNEREMKEVNLESIVKKANRLSPEKKAELIARMNAEIDAENAVSGDSEV